MANHSNETIIQIIKEDKKLHDQIDVILYLEEKCGGILERTVAIYGNFTVANMMEELKNLQIAKMEKRYNQSILYTLKGIRFDDKMNIEAYGYGSLDITIQDRFAEFLKKQTDTSWRMFTKSIPVIQPQYYFCSACKSIFLWTNPQKRAVCPNKCQNSKITFAGDTKEEAEYNNRRNP